MSHQESMQVPGAREDGLYRTGKFCGGIRADIARRLPWYQSDWVDGLMGGPKTFTAALYMFFACLAPGIAFGAYFDQVSGGQSGVVEYLVTQGVSGVIFALISGQPLIILRPTGPITVFISQLYLITDSVKLPFLPVMSWTGTFVGLYMITIAVTDTCAAISYCSRFTQDLFGCFVSVIFISLGIGNIVEKFTGEDTYSAPYQLILTAATLWIALQMAWFKKARFFNGKIREFVSDFAVPMAVMLLTILAGVADLNVEPLPVPKDFEPTKPGRPWLVDVCPAEKCGTCIAVGAMSAIPLVLLFFIDQNVTSLLTQHPDHRLKKGASFHYNFLLLGIFNIVFPLFGCPFVTGSLPHSPQFTQALATTEVVRENGHEKTVIKGVCENRVSPLLVNVLILICLPVINVLDNIPTSVICDALFLFMGITGLPGNNCFERVKLIFTEEALYPPLPFTVEEVPRRSMNVFTCVQFSYVALLYLVSKSPIALAFPVFLVSSIPVRMMLPTLTCGVLTPEMVAILDHERPPAPQAEKLTVTVVEEDGEKRAPASPPLKTAAVAPLSEQEAEHVDDAAARELILQAPTAREDANSAKPEGPN